MLAAFTFMLALFAQSTTTGPSPSPTAAASDDVNARAQSLQHAIATATSYITTMFTTGHVDAAWFAPSAAQQRPAAKVNEVLEQLRAQLGAYKSVEFTPDGFIAHFERGTDVVLIHMDANEKIDGLFFQPPQLAK